MYRIVLWALMLVFTLSGFGKEEEKKLLEERSELQTTLSLEEERSARDARLLIRGEKAKALQQVLAKMGKVKISLIPLRKEINHFLFKFLERAFKEATEQGSDIVILDMSTPGGAVDQTKKILELIRKFDGLVYVLVNDEATSAGAIISFGCDAIYMVPGATIGSAAPIIMTGQGVMDLPPDVQEKMLSYVRATARAQAEENGYDPLLAEAMIDNDVLVRRGEVIISEKDKLLNLTAAEATKVYDGEKLLAEAKLNDLEGLLTHIGLEKGSYDLVETTINSSEGFAESLVPVLPIIWLVSLMLIYSEVQSPGFGTRGILGIGGVVFSLFIQNYAGMANFWEVFVIILGIVLLAFEFFVIPGFGFAGIAGLLLIAGGLFMSFLQEVDFKEIPDYDFRFAHYFDIAVTNTLIVGGGCIVVFILFLTLLPRLPFYRKLTLMEGATGAATEGSLLDEHGYELLNQHQQYLGKLGVCKSDLRPAGIVIIEGERVDVLTAGEKIMAGTEVKVIAVEGTSITVEPLENNEEKVESL